MDVLKRILQWVSPYRKIVYEGFVLMVLAIAARMVMPYISAVLVNDVLPNHDMNLLLKLCALIIAITAVRAVMLYRRGMIFERVSQSVVYDLRTKLYAHMQELSYAFYDMHHIGEIMSRMSGDIDGVRVLVMTACVGMTESLLLFLFSLVSMALMNWQLMLVMLIFCPLIAFVAVKFRAIIRPVHTTIREQNAVLNTKTQENIAGVRVVKAFAQEENEIHSFYEENQLILNLHLKATRIWSNYFPLLDMVASLATPMLLLVGGYMVLRGSLSLGMLVGATGYVWMIVMPLRQVANFVNQTTNGIVSAEKLIYYSDLGSRVRNPQTPVEPEERRGQVDFDTVRFSYDREAVLNGIDLHVTPGQTVAVMGATGTGKTTLVTLLGRYYDVTGGCLRVDGVDVREQNLHALRRSIGQVMQETFLYSETIAANIAFGRPEATMEEIIAAAKVAQADEFIRQMPLGYDTVVGERGLGLSGGQKQRVALARAVLFNPKILVLDDATSAVDMETEADIQEGLKAVMAGRTTFIIAHRISSVRQADQIVILHEGRIAERGTHGELLAVKGLYYEMFMDQTRDFVVTIDPEKAGEAHGSAAQLG